MPTFRATATAWLRSAFALVCFCALAVANLEAAAPLSFSDPVSAVTQYKIENWQTEQGLPLNIVQAVQQTRDGYLWVGTGGGLARFDGVRFSTFERSDVPQLASRSIFGFLEARDGTLWIGHAEGAAMFRDGSFRVAFGREVTDGRRVWSFAESADGTIWAATENGLVAWKGSVQRVYHVADGLPSERLRSIAVATDGTLWIASTGGGLISFDGRRFNVLDVAHGFPHNAVRAVLADERGGVWASTAGGGLAHIDAHGKLTKYDTTNGLPTNQLTALAHSPDGSLWIGTWGAGVCRLRDGRIETLSTDGGLAGEQIWALHVDREQSVWVGTWVGGLNRLRPRDFVVLGTPEGLSHANVRSVLHARDGSVWLTTAGGGVNHIAAGAVRVMRASDGLPSDETSTLLEDREGSIWIGTYTAGIARLRNGTIERFAAPEGLQSLDTRSLYQDRRGVIWAGTMAGLARFDGSRFAMVREQGAPMEGVSTILEDHTGAMWFATGEGLFSLRDGRWSHLTRSDGLGSNWIMHVIEDADGTLWIGTNGEGINRLKNGKLALIPAVAGLWDGMAQVLLPDRHGNLWITCNRGFYRVSLAELNAYADGRAKRVDSLGFGSGDALRSSSFAGGHQPAGAVDAQGRLWLPSFSGVVIVDPARLPHSNDPPVVRIEEVNVNGREVTPRSAIELPPGSVPLTIRFRTTTLRTAERARFRYRMDGSNSGWIDAGQSREAFFPALPHGTYTFRIAASGDGKRWRESETPLSITVRPHFFQTVWFYALVLLLAIAATAGFLRLRTRNLERQKEAMARLVTEKTEELRLANEHLARLSFVDALTGVANRRRFDEALEQEWQRALRFQTSLALLVADVDHFKAFNDSLGHVQGDRCLVLVAEVLQDAARRAGDLVARYGGEEFVVLIPGADHRAAFEFAELLRRECEARALPHPASSVGPCVTISIGVAAAVPRDGASASELLHEADAALYRAKRSGRNRVGTLEDERSVSA